jgi:hypothetical protein
MALIYKVPKNVMHPGCAVLRFFLDRSNLTAYAIGMSSILIGLIAFVCAFGGAMLGLFLRNILPEHHLNKESRDAVMMGTGLIATLTALVLGLLVSSAKETFDSMNSTLTQSGTRMIMLDRTLVYYGPQTGEIRDTLRRSLVGVIVRLWPEEAAELKESDTLEKGVIGIEVVEKKLRMLVPENDSQRNLQARALQLTGDLLEARWLTIEQSQASLPTAFLIILCFWLVILFVCIGLFAPPNKTVIAVLFVCAMSVAGAVFLMREMNHPLHGVMKVSGAPLIKALEHIGK